MGIQAIFGNTIVEKSSDMLILSLTPVSDLTHAKQKEKIDLICARNRILVALNEECKKLSNSSQKNLIEEKITIIKEFFREIGGEVENTTVKLSFYSPAKLVEGPIPSSIIASTKPDSQCSPKEKAEKEKQKELRDQIIEASFAKATSEKVRNHLTRLLIELGSTHPATQQMHFAGG